MKNPENNQLSTLINRYFDGLTSLEEERLLRSMLTDSKNSSKEADETRAVMGFLMYRPKRQRRLLKIPKTILKIAAAITVITITGSIIFFGKEQESDYIAYVDGNKIQDPEKVLALITEDLAGINAASDDINRDIQSQFDIISDEFSSSR